MELRELVRFFFGHGWWIAWHVLFYATLLFFVGFILAMFATELRPAGAKPNTPSPGSALVFFVAFTLAVLTLINASILVFNVGWPWYADMLFILGTTAVTLVLGGVLNNYLATDQGYAAFWMNVGFVLLSTLANLMMMWRFER